MKAASVRKALEALRPDREKATDLSLGCLGLILPLALLTIDNSLRIL
jgi:hypothetical protein